MLIAFLTLSFCAGATLSSSLPTQETIVASNAHVKLGIDLKTGLYRVSWGENASLPGAAGFIRLEDQRIRRTTDYTEHTVTDSKVKDGFGEGTKIELTHRKSGEPDLIHTFWVYRDRPEIYISLTARSESRIATNFFSPVESSVQLSKGDPLQVLFVPFDNDMFVRYNSQNWGPEADTFETTAIYDNESRNGLVVGSVDHDLWKTGIAVRDRQAKQIGKMTVYGGAAGHWSHDKEVHGLVGGKTIKTARIFVGWFPDWRDGMESYARSNALVKPPLAWSEGVPFGWNSWGAVKMNLTNSLAVAATDFLSKTLVPAGFKSTTPTYVNLDAFWDNMKEEELVAFVENAHKAGLRAGIYWTPFAAWGDDLNSAVEGVQGKFRYWDLVIKDSKGQPLPKVDNGWPLDPTHPVTKERNTYYYKKFLRLGFDYLKLDFLSHASYEGQRYDKSVQTGIQAYNIGMQDTVDAFDPKKIGKPFFLSLGIAPLFPHGYGHARRMSCDAFSNIAATEYMLNSLTYSWWSHRHLYPFNDPDHLPVYQPSGGGVVPAIEALSRMVSGVISGGMLLNGDDLTNAEARRRVQSLFTNPEMLALAKKGLTFRPIEAGTGAAATDAFVLHDPVDKSYYLAVFNYSGSKVMKSVELGRAGIPTDVRYAAFDLASGKTVSVSRSVRLELEGTQCALLRLRQL